MPGTYITTNAESLAVKMRRRSGLYVDAVRNAIRENAETVKRQAENFSRARYYSLAQLRQMGHPYARRAPHPPKPAHIINRQSGAFRAGFKVAYRPNIDGATATVYNVVPYAKFMLGTRYMIARPVLDEAIRRTKAERDRNIKNARRRAYYRVTGR